MHPDMSGTPRRIPSAFRLFLAVFVPSAIAVAAVLLVIHRTRVDSEREMLADRQLQAVDLRYEAVRAAVRSIASDVLLLNTHGDLSEYLDTGVHSRLDTVIEELVAFAGIRGVYDQIRYLDAGGREVVRVQLGEGDEPFVVPEEALQDKSDRYYFRETNALAPGAVYISPFDLNVEHGRIEEPHKPMVRIGTPVFDGAGRRRGVLVLNYLGRHLLAAFRAAAEGSAGTPMLVDADGYWISGPSPEVEWGFQLPAAHDTSFARAYPDEWERIRLRDAGQFRSREGLFTFRTVHLLDEMPRPRRPARAGGPALVFSATEDRRWKVVSLVPAAVLASGTRETVRSTRFSLALWLAVLAVAATGIAHLARRRARAEQRLEAAAAERAHLVTAVEQTTESIVVADADGRVCYANPAYERATGRPAAEAPDLLADLRAHVPPDGPDADAIWESIRRGQTWTGRLVHARADGAPQHEEATITPVVNEAGAITNFVAVRRDISRQLTMEVQLRAAQKLESIGQLAAGIAHEINTPVQYIGDNATFLRDSFAELAALLDTVEELTARGEEGATPDELRGLAKLADDIDVPFLRTEVPRAIGETLAGVERVAGIVAAMKRFSHPGSDAMELVDLNRSIESTVLVARNEWKYVADVEMHLDEELPRVPGEGGALNQAILNLIVNAAHAIGDVVGDGTERRGTIRIATSHDDDHVRIEVGDTGGGIPEAARMRIYDPFFTTKPVGKGTGQGLAIVHAVVVNQHGGSIDFDTELGAGTTFVVRLPYRDVGRGTHFAGTGPSSEPVPASAPG